VLNREVFFSLKEAKVVIENWRQEYNTIRPTAASMACPLHGGYLAVGLSTASADRKQFGMGFNSNLKTGTKTGQVTERFRPFRLEPDQGQN